MDTPLSGTPIKTESLTYNENGHIDRLISCNGKAIGYNSMGCPVSYDGKSFMWNRGKLSGISERLGVGLSAPSKSYTFAYNALGQRVTKTYAYHPGAQTLVDYVTDCNSVFTYDNAGRLIHEKRSENYYQGYSYSREFMYLYDESSMIGFTYSYNGATPSTYYYHRNLQGDVIAIYSPSGTKVVEYAYDAWGNCTITYGANNDIATANAIRYRGYYFDTETGLYYLNARYYNPEWRRFISPANASTLNPQVVNGLNLYCYCNNNPISIVFNGSINNVNIRNINNKSMSASNNMNNSNINHSSGNRNSMDHISWPKVNSVSMFHHTYSLIKDPIISWVLGNISYTTTVQLNDAETFYSFTNMGNDGYSIGLGMNLGNWYGANAYISVGGFGTGWQLTPWLTGSLSWSIENGISISNGIIAGDVTHEITVSFGNGALFGFAMCGWLASIPTLGTKVAAATIASIIFIVDLFI